MLQYYYSETNGYSKERSPTVLAKVFQKSSKTITRELKRGMVTHALGDYPFERTEYNAEYAQLDAQQKMQYKGPLSKSGKHYTLVKQIAFLILEASLQVLCGVDDTGAEWAVASRVTYL